MSRSGYSDDADGNIALWRGQVASATRGKRGQRFFKELLDALDAMPKKELHAEVFDEQDGRVCALGALAQVKGIDTSNLDPEDDWAAEYLANKLDVAHQLTREVIYTNDEAVRGNYIRLDHHRLHGLHYARLEPSPYDRWRLVREWVARQIKVEA